MKNHDFGQQQAITFVDGEWLSGNPPLLGPLTHASWMASTVFDGARYFEGVAPDLDLHCQRLVDSATEFGLNAVHSAGEMQEICEDVAGEFELGHIVAVHREGVLQLTDIAIFVAASATHRREAIRGVEKIVERIKHEAPIWKLETYVDGQSEWVHCNHHHHGDDH